MIAPIVKSALWRAYSEGYREGLRQAGKPMPEVALLKHGDDAARKYVAENVGNVIGR